MMDEWLSEIIEKCAASPCMWASSLDAREQLAEVFKLPSDERRDVIASMIDRIDEQVIETVELRARLAEAEAVVAIACKRTDHERNTASTMPKEHCEAHIEGRMRLRAMMHEAVDDWRAAEAARGKDT